MNTYEKKYKDALSRARQFSEHPLQEDSSNIVEYIFPELKESEDERIRKRIIHALHGDVLDMEETNKAIAWLEKQGEQKPFDYENANIQQKDFAPKIEPFDKYEGLTDFERTLADICIGWIGEEFGWKQYIKDNADVLLKIAIKMFNSVQDAPFKQKPTDNDMVEALRTEYEKGKADAIAEMQKPTWSEADSDFMYDTLSNLTELKDRYGKDYGNVGKCIDWLKSLKQRIGGKV